MCDREAILPQIAAEFSQDQRSTHGAVFDGGHEPMNLRPLSADVLHADRFSDEHGEIRIITGLAGHVQARVGQILDARRGAEVPQMHQCEDVIRKSAVSV